MKEPYVTNIINPKYSQNSFFLKSFEKKHAPHFKMINPKYNQNRFFLKYIVWKESRSAIFNGAFLSIPPQFPVWAR